MLLITQKMNKEEQLKKLKLACSEMNIDFGYFIWKSYLTVELGKGYKPTVDQLDDLYCVFVSGVLCNLGSGKKPEYMEDIGPTKEERYAIQGYQKLRDNLIYMGCIAYPYEEWIEQNSESEEWVDLALKAAKLNKEFDKNPEGWCIQLRNNCKSKRR